VGIALQRASKILNDTLSPYSPLVLSVEGALHTKKTANVELRSPKPTFHSSALVPLAEKTSQAFKLVLLLSWCCWLRSRETSTRIP